MSVLSRRSPASSERLASFTSTSATLPLNPSLSSSTYLPSFPQPTPKPSQPRSQSQSPRSNPNSPSRSQLQQQAQLALSPFSSSNLLHPRKISLKKVEAARTSSFLKLTSDVASNNFFYSLLSFVTFFTTGNLIGFLTAIYDHETLALAYGLGICVLVCICSSLRLPIVYHIFVEEDSLSWRKDESCSLYVSIVLVGFSFGLGLPAEFFLLQIVIDDPDQLEYEKGGWMVFVGLLVPLLVGLVAIVADQRMERRDHVKWGGKVRTRRERLVIVKKEKEREGRERVALMIGDDNDNDNDDDNDDKNEGDDEVGKKYGKISIDLKSRMQLIRESQQQEDGIGIGVL